MKRLTDQKLLVAINAMEAVCAGKREDRMLHAVYEAALEGLLDLQDLRASQHGAVQRPAQPRPTPASTQTQPTAADDAFFGAILRGMGGPDFARAGEVQL